MEATLEKPSPEFNLGNKVPNSFEELNAMTKNRYANNNEEKPKYDSTLRFARSMNLPKFTSTVKSQNISENKKYESQKNSNFSFLCKIILNLIFLGNCR